MAVDRAGSPSSGAATLDDIDAELQRDPSSQGVLVGARGPRILPDADSKAQVWQTIWTDDTLSNYELFALAEGLLPPRPRGAHRARTSLGTSTISPRWPRRAAG